MNAPFASSTDTAEADRIISIAILAVGGQGGGVLTEWIVDVAERNSYRAQSTSVAGVAQRTGATIYYIEMCPDRGRQPVFSLAPTPGDVDILMTTNQGSAYLYRTDVTSGNRSLRFHLRGTKSNRDAIGALVRVTTPEGAQSRMVKTGSSYLSQSELALTFGLAKDAAANVEVIWPSGTRQTFNDVKANQRLKINESRGIVP